MGAFSLTGITVSADILAGASILMTSMIGVCGYFVGLNKKASVKEKERQELNHILVAELFQKIEPFYQKNCEISRFMLESYHRNNHSIPDTDGKIIGENLSVLYNDAFIVLNRLKNELILRADETLYLNIVSQIANLENAIKKTTSDITGPNINNINRCFMELEKALLRPTCTDVMLDDYLKSKYQLKTND